MNPRPLRLLLAFALAVSVSAFSSQAADKKPAAKDAKADAPAKELTREEIAKLGGFEPAPVDPVDAGPVVLNFDVLMVSLPDALAIPLVDMFRQPGQNDAACQKLMQLIEAKKAKVTAWPRMQTKNGNRAVAENIQEIRYATEFEKIDPPAEAKGAAPAPEDPAAPAPPAGPAPAPAIPPAVGVMPTAFETRNAGATIEMEPTVWPDEKPWTSTSRCKMSACSDGTASAPRRTAKRKSA